MADGGNEVKIKLTADAKKALTELEKLAKKMEDVGDRSKKASKEISKTTDAKGNTRYKVHGKFDVVVANIVADIIVMFTKDAGQFLKEDGLFITSGIIDTREQDVLEAFEKYGFEVVGRHESCGWLCFETKLKK